MKALRHRLGEAQGFTLIEIMLVIGILAIVMAMAIPPIYRGMSKEPMRQAVSGVRDACTAARNAAILGGKRVCFSIRPLDHMFAAESGSVSDKPGASLSGRISDSISLEMVDVNMLEYRDRDVARVWFHPNGTCDEFTLILLSDKGEWRKLVLEPTTGIMTIHEVRE